MQTIFDTLREAVVGTNLDGEFLIANLRAVDLVGMGPTAMSPQTWSEHYGVFQPDEVTLVESMKLPLYRAMLGETTNDVELFIRNPQRTDGVFIKVSGRPLFDEVDRVIGGVITFHDITESKAKEKQIEKLITDLQAQTQLLEAIFNSIGDGIIVVDKSGHYIL